MIIKIVTLFLIFIALLAMFGKLRLLLPKRAKLAQGKCASCGAPRVGKGPCPCGKA